jgi:hypothetical protein
VLRGWVRSGRDGGWKKGGRGVAIPLSIVCVCVCVCVCVVSRQEQNASWSSWDKKGWGGWMWEGYDEQRMAGAFVFGQLLRKFKAKTSRAWSLWLCQHLWALQGKKKDRRYAL